MKILKKITAIVAAVSMAVGMSTVSLFAENAYRLHIDSDSASVGETVSVKVVIDAGSTGIGAIVFKLNYDPTELELVSVTPGEELDGWITGDDDGFNLDTPGTIGFAYATIAKKKAFSEKSVMLINASFNVLKPNAGFTLTEVQIGAADDDITDLTAQGSIEDSAVVECSHKNTQETVTQPTCKDEGKKEVICRDCGEKVSSETLPKTNNHTWGEGRVTKEASCTEKGILTYTCAVCGSTKTENTEALGHDWDNGTVTKEPTCTEVGIKTIACTRCSETKTENIEALGHNWGNGTVTKEPTCTEAGIKTIACTRCDETKTENIEALGHDWDNGTVTKEPTCTENGIKTIACTRCDETKTEELSALGHDWGEWTVTKEATADEEGEEARECKTCGEKETRSVEKLPPAVTTTTFNGHFYIPETTAATSAPAPAESESITAAQTTAAPVTDQTSEAAAAVTTTAAPVENTPTDTDSSSDNTVTDVTTAAENTSNDVGNANGNNVSGNNAGGENLPTGVVLAVIPAAAAAAAGVVIFRKRK